MRRHLLAAFALLILAACGGGGGSGSATASPAPAPAEPDANPNLRLSLPTPGLRAEQLALVVAEGDAVSEAAAAAYQAARGVPAANVLRVRVNTGSATLDASAFNTLRADIEARLPAGVQALLLTWTSPSRVLAAGGCAMGITAAMTLGYDARWCVSGGSCRATARSVLYDSETPAPATDFGLRPSMLLAARSEAAARSLINRGLAAEGTRPSGSGYLLRTSDAARSVRADEYAGLVAAWTGLLDLRFLQDRDALRDTGDVLFYFTGLAQVPELSTLGFRPGALADALTSFGGQLPDASGTGAAGQMPITAWLEAGASASYGTVEEPCNFPQKFSRASVLVDRYWRGETAIEAYWKAVEQPGQGLFVGDPLARPFGAASSLTVENGRYRLQTRGLRPQARYALEYRVGSAGSWVELAAFSGERGRPLDATAPLPPAAATQLRWRGPCPNDASLSCTLAASP